MKTNFVKSRWFFTMLLFVTTMIMPTMMLAEESITPTRPTTGDGSAENPFQISSREELYWFAGLVNGTLEGVEQDASANAKLMNDITVNKGVLDAVNKGQVSESNFIEWEPVGTTKVAYTGTFDGNKHTISGLYSNNPKAHYVGLFGCIGYVGKVSNVGVSDSYFPFSRDNKYVGGICAWNYGELQNCSNSSTVIGKEDYDTNIGGVCGYNSGTVKDCKNTGSVSGGVTIGGVCGDNNGIIAGSGNLINCFNEGTVNGEHEVGGVCGKNTGTIKSCYNTASVSGQYEVGGVCGYSSAGTITNCFNKGTVSGKGSFVGGVCGDNSSGPITNCYYLEDTAQTGIGAYADESGKAWKMSIEPFKSGEVAWLLNGKGLGEQVCGQQLGIDQSPVPGSAYKVIKAAQGDKDANGNYTYWATFSNLTNDVTLSVPLESGRTLNVYNATVSGGKLTLTERDNHQVAMDEGVLLKTDGEYVNAKANERNVLTAASSDENHLVATPAETQTITPETGYILYRLTYNDADTKDRLGFYLGVAEGNSLKATPGKAYLKVSENEAKAPSSAALTRSFVFGGGSETTGIEGITIMGTDVQRHGTIEGIFDLQGRKISNPTKGIYIKNNKKVIIK